MKYVLRFIINFYWNIIGNIILAILWGIAGIFFIVTIVFYDKGISCFKMARFVRKPFGKVVMFTGNSMLFGYVWAATIGPVIFMVTIAVMLISFATFGGIFFIRKWEKILFSTLYPFSIEIMTR